MSRNSSAPPRVALAALRLSLQAQRAAPPIDDSSHKTSVPWVSWTAMLNHRSQFHHNCTGERLPGKEADIISGNAMIVGVKCGRKPANSYINAYAVDPRQKCET